MSRLTRRQLPALVAAGLAAPALASAPAYPSRPIRLIIPYPPGGGTDALARPWAERMRGKLGQPLVIENRGGAATNIGMEMAARAVPDGQTLIINADNVALFPHLYRKLALDEVVWDKSLPLGASGHIFPEGLW